FIEILRKKSLGTLRQRVPNVVWHSSKASARRLVLVRRLWRHARGDLRRAGHDLREADHGDCVVVADRAAVDLLQEVDLLVQAAELGVVVLDVAWREVAYALDLDRVDDRVEDALARRVLVADRDHDHLALAVLVALVAQADGRRLAAALELVDEDRRIEVQDEHGG